MDLQSFRQSIARFLPVSKQDQLALIKKFADEVLADRKNKKKPFDENDTALTKASMAKQLLRKSELLPGDFNESQSRLRRKCLIHQMYPEFVEKEINSVESKYRDYVWLMIHELEKTLYQNEWPSEVPVVSEGLGSQ